MGCAVGCNEGNELATGGFDFASPGDGAGVDGAAPADLAAGPDLAGKQCGQIVSCVVQCGITNVTCDLACEQGASPMAIQQEVALISCAAQHCLFQPDGGAGGGGMSGILLCLLSSCPAEVGGCSGLLTAPM